ncbi:AMP-binding protein [Asaia prunellae]|uniref:AMP-binding protein n=1 Tax=Asaia prunellae TaxID=610245 RepID=UPI00046F4973|nr:AMP-binding protein [Asaia prunellae]
MYEENQLLIDAQAWKERSLIELLYFRRITKGEDPIFLFLGDGENVTETLSAETLHRQASRAGAHLARTLERNSRIVLLFENGLDYIIAFFACLYAGHVPVSGIYPSSIGARERFAFVLQDCQGQAVLGKKETLQLFHFDAGLEQPVKWIPLESALKSSREIEPIPALSESLALIQYTSGSTETPKGVGLSHRNICHNIYIQLISYQYQDTGLIWLPFTHDMGLIGGVLPALAAGKPFYFMSPDKFIEKPSRWLDAISRFGATLSGGPDFAYRYCARLPPNEISPHWDLSRWKVAFNGSDSINPETLDNFYNVFKNNGFVKEAFYSCYGLAENALLVTSGTKDQGIRLTSFDRFSLSQGKAVATSQHIESSTTLLASCGLPHEEQHVHIVDPDTMTFLAEDLVGEIWVDSPCVSIGYINNPQRNAYSFIEIDGKRYLRTQDLGFLHEKELYHVGRSSEKFTHEGNIYYTNDISLSLSKAFAGAVCLVAPPCLPQRRLPSLIIEYETAPDPTGLRARVSETMKRYRITQFAYYAIRKGFVIRTPSGKLRADLTLDNIMAEQSAILVSGDTESPVVRGASSII